jgi:hypothetical protein
MAKLKNLGGFIVVGGLITAILLLQRVNNRLSVELEQVRNERESVQRIKSTNAALASNDEEQQRLREEHLELMRLRGQANAFRQGQQELTNTQIQIAQLRAAVKTTLSRPVADPKKLKEGLKPAGEFRNLGFATPGSAFETVLWAGANGDTNILAQSITFDEESRGRAEDLLANAPDAIRSRFQTIQQLTAYLLTRTTPVDGMRVLGDEPVDDNHTRLQIEWQYRDGRVQPNSWHFYRASNGVWQMLMEPGLVNKLGQMLGAEAALIVAGQK